LDILPSSIAAGEGKQKGIKKLDGVNLISYIDGKNKKAPHEALYWRRGVAAAMRTDNWKLIRVKENVLLFDLSKDLSETTNLAGKYPGKTKEMLAKLAQWEKGLDSPHWTSAYGDNSQIMKHRMETTGREMERMYP
jgi:arylsulfatase A-like enzyme